MNKKMTASAMEDLRVVEKKTKEQKKVTSSKSDQGVMETNEILLIKSNTDKIPTMYKALC